MSSSVPTSLNRIGLYGERQAALSIRKVGEDDESEVSDEKLLALIGEGSRDALGSLFRRYARVVRGIAYKVLRDPFEADDLVQEIFLLIERKCRAFDGSKGPARHWILQTAYHRAIDRRRYLTHRHFYTHSGLDENIEHIPEVPNTEFERMMQFIDFKDARLQFQSQFASLSENQRRTLTLYFFDGYTLDEIAHELGQSRDNVRNHYFRGLDKLRKQIFHNHGRRRTET